MHSESVYKDAKHVFSNHQPRCLAHLLLSLSPPLSPSPAVSKSASTPPRSTLLSPGKRVRPAAVALRSTAQSPSTPTIVGLIRCASGKQPTASIERCLTMCGVFRLVALRTARPLLEHGIAPSVPIPLHVQRTALSKASTTRHPVPLRLETPSPLPSPPPPTPAHVYTSSTRPANHTNCSNSWQRSSPSTSTCLR